MKREELLKSKEYWMVKIQNDLFNLLNEYMISNNLSRKQLADKLGFTKGYISQILNGNFDHRISKFVELSLSVGKVPEISFDNIENILMDDELGQSDKPKNERMIVILEISPEMLITTQKLNPDQVEDKKEHDVNDDQYLFKYNLNSRYEADKTKIYG
ncbi:helix-turn-helix domain-containing protein [Bacteroidota bacterium]